ncbi:unnamed protein product [Orchesella dallaii]
MPAYSSFNETWSFGILGCELYAASVGLCGMASLLTLSVIAAERFSVIMGAPVRWLSSKKACVLIWILSLGLVIPPFVGWSKYVIEGVGTSCSWDYTSRDFRNRVYYIFLLTFGFFIPVSIIIISYLGILQVVCKQSSRMNSFSRNGGLRKKSPTRSDLKTAQVILSIIVCFLVSWTPYAIISMIGQFGDASLLSPLSTALPAVFAKSSVIYNPFVYGLSHPLFRTAFATLKAKYLGKRAGGGITVNPRHHHHHHRHCQYCNNKHAPGAEKSRKVKLVVTARGDGTYNTTYDHRHCFHLDRQKMQGQGLRGKIPRHLLRHFTGNAENGERADRCPNENKSSDPQSTQCHRSKDSTMELGMSTMQTTPNTSIRGKRNVKYMKKGAWIFKNRGENQPSGMSEGTAGTGLNTYADGSSDGGDCGELETSLSIQKNPNSAQSNEHGRSMKNSYTFFMCEQRKRRQDAIQQIFFRSENCLNDLFMEKEASNAFKSHLSTTLDEQGARILSCTKQECSNGSELKSDQCKPYFKADEKAALYHSNDNSVTNELRNAGSHANDLNFLEGRPPKLLSDEMIHSICCSSIAVNSDMRGREFSLVSFNSHEDEGNAVSKELKNQRDTFVFHKSPFKTKPNFSFCQYQKGKVIEGNANTMLVRRNLHKKKSYLSVGDMEKAVRIMTSMSNGMKHDGKKGELVNRLRKSMSLSGLKMTAVESTLTSQNTQLMEYPAISELTLNGPNERKESTRTRMSEITSFKGFEIDNDSCSWYQCHNNAETPFSSADEDSRDDDIDPLCCSGGSHYASCNSDLCSQDSVEDKLAMNYAAPVASSSMFS